MTKWDMQYVQSGPEAAVRAARSQPEPRAVVAVQKPLNAEETRHEYFGYKAESYDQGREDEPKWQSENEAVIAALTACREGVLADGSPLDGSESVLDIPSGTGRFIQPCLDLGLQWRGLDVSDEMSNQARAKFPDVSIGHGDILDIPEKDESYDIVLTIRLLDKVTEDEAVRAINEMTRVARRHVIFNLLSGPDIIRRNRSWTHRYDVIRHALVANQFPIIHTAAVREPDYHVWHCTCL